MVSRIIAGAVALVLAASGGFYVLTVPQRLDAAALPAEGTGDAARGERVFWAGGCTSCHAAKAQKGDERLKLGGGDPLVTKFGTFHAPNISPDPADGIGAWSLADFANAMQRGVDPQGRHLYPAFPYTSYANMTKGDVADLFAYLKTLPPVAGRAAGNDLPFPFNVRRGLGLWKLAFAGTPGPVVALPADAPQPVRDGQYLVEGPGHCGQCHTPRGLFGAGGLDRAHWLGGAPNPEGEGRVPDITPSPDGIGDWSQGDIASYLESGFTPDFDTVGGSMVEVQANLARLPAADREAIAAYLKAVPPVEGTAAAPGG
ncbi:cytochrome c [Aurantimonas sp. Leaf443]|uniref:cytochrome c n=1 Tax=Aurantimonas sp. Leaf443 TaxID=1736378 RepID=UPI000700845F|nr:cytochrome c [Aurantimonas sp. Leaf443]KQT85975.1 cytochrome C [Aurantimonas sp. Leaf443]